MVGGAAGLGWTYSPHSMRTARGGGGSARLRPEAFAPEEEDYVATRSDEEREAWSDESDEGESDESDESESDDDE